MADMDLGALLKRQSEAAKLAKLEYVSLYSIDPDPRNFYDVSNSEELIDSIREQGLQQPLLVRTDPDHAGRVIVISGHRRLEALLELDAAKELPDPEHIPVIRNDTAKTAEEQEWQLILGNKDSRQLSNYEIQKQAERVEALLLELAKQGHTFKGRTRDKVAELINVNKSKLSRLQAISKHLAPCWHAMWATNVMPESVAYELQQAPEHHQKIIFEEVPQLAGYMSAAAVKVMRQKMEAVDQLTCPDGLDGDFGCANRDGKLRHICHESERDTGTVCTVCCTDCCNLETCKWACPHLAAKITELKRQRAEVHPAPAKSVVPESVQSYLDAQDDENKKFMDFMRRRGFDLLMSKYLDIGSTRKDGVEGLKKHHGLSHHGGGDPNLDYQCDRTGWYIQINKGKKICRSWTETWDAMTLIAMERAQAALDDDDDDDDADVPKMGTSAGWHDAATEKPEIGRQVILMIYLGDDSPIIYTARWTGSGWVSPSGRAIVSDEDWEEQWSYIPDRSKKGDDEDE